ncbi:MAG: phosphate ABC transporter permease [Deltaproteobacteria bacterium]|nr:MAG: phosphate ABC transporter permease [Deltaproteobacteria bacterium]RLB77525.1 MAG: phosphate ABC transporter permease [Deltaproteobacteria bacterium]
MNRLLNFGVYCWSWIATLGVFLVVGLLLSYLLAQGLPTIGKELFFGDAPAWEAIFGQVRVWDALWPACVGTLFLVLLATLLAVPIGISSGIYLACFAPKSFKRVLSLLVELLAGTPSIVMGLFGFAFILFLRNTFFPDANTSLLLAAACLALLILPYLIFTTQAALESLSDEYRLIGPSLGFSQIQTVFHVLLPAAGRGILSGVVLSIGRAAEDTAVIMLTGVIANAGLPQGLFGKFEALPFRIFYLAAEYQTPAELDSAYGTALVLLCLTGMLYGGALALHKTLELRWNQHG